MYKSEHLITSRHYLILGVIAFAAGIFITTNLAANLLFSAVIFMAAVFVVLSAILLIKCLTKNKNLKHILLPLFLLLCTLLGVVRIFATELLFPSPLKTHIGQKIWLTGTVATDPTPTSQSWSHYFEFEVAQVSDENVSPETMIIYITGNQWKTISKGDKICCWTEIQEPTRNDAPSNYDYYTHLRGKNIFYTGNIRTANHIEFETPTTIISSLKAFGNFASSGICDAADKILDSNPHLSAILKGILVGDKTNFTDETYQKFSYSGLSHIVSVSGMHFSILFSFILIFFNTARLNKRFSLIMAIPLTVLFTATANFTPSVCRAAIMYLMMIAATLFRQRYSSLNALFLSLGIILMVAPYSLYSKSLTLSFCATLGIHIYYKYSATLIKSIIPFKEERKHWGKRAVHWVLDKTAASLLVAFSVCMGTFFFSFLFFGSMSWIQFFTNLLVIPLVSVTFVLGYLACLLYYVFPPASALLCYPLEWCLGGIYATADFFGKEQFTIGLGNFNSTGALFIVYLGFAVLVYMLLKTWYDTHIDKERKKEEKPLL